MKQILSAIDVGSNAIRMMIAEHRDGRIIELKKFRSPVRIGHDVFKDGYISEKTIESVLDTFKQFAHLNRKYNVILGRSVATSATREAKNGHHLVKAILEKSHIKVEIIDGIEEAQLIFQAVEHQVDLKNKNALLIDIGGGSVEVTLSQNAKLKTTKSFPMGTVRILDQMKKRNLDEKSIKILIGDLMPPLANYVEKNISGLNIAFAVGTGGNLECMARLKMDLLNKTPNNYITLKELVEISEKLLKINQQTRIEKLGMRPDRADVIIPAILVVKTIMRQAGTEKIHIPCVGLRDGLLWGLVT